MLNVLVCGAALIWTACLGYTIGFRAGVSEKKIMQHLGSSIELDGRKTPDEYLDDYA